MGLGRTGLQRVLHFQKNSFPFMRSQALHTRAPGPCEEYTPSLEGLRKCPMVVDKWVSGFISASYATMTSSGSQITTASTWTLMGIAFCAVNMILTSKFMTTTACSPMTISFGAISTRPYQTSNGVSVVQRYYDVLREENLHQFHHI